MPRCVLTVLSNLNRFTRGFSDGFFYPNRLTLGSSWQGPSWGRMPPVVPSERTPQLGDNLLNLNMRPQFRTNLDHATASHEKASKFNP